MDARTHEHMNKKNLNSVSIREMKLHTEMPHAYYYLTHTHARGIRLVAGGSGWWIHAQCTRTHS